MRLKTRTWDLNGPQFTLKVFTEAKEGDGYTRYKCELSFSADQKCLPYSPVELNKNTYQPGVYYTKKEDGTFEICQDDFNTQVNYYKKSIITWELLADSQAFDPSTIKIEQKEARGSFSLDELTSSLIHTFDIVFDEYPQKTILQSDYVDITLNVNWDQYTYANNTRTFESHNGQLYANISHGDDFFWAPELYYNNDYVRMRDELSVYWDYEYHKDGEDLSLSLILTEEKEEQAEGEAVLNTRELAAYKLRPDTTSHKIQLGSLPIQPTPGAKLYAELYATGIINGVIRESQHVKGIVGQVNTPPNPPRLSFSSTSQITEDMGTSIQVTAKNETTIIEGVQDFDILYYDDQGVKRLGEGYEDMQFIAKNFNNDYVDKVAFGDNPILYERNNWTGDVWYENDWLYGDKPIKLTGISESGSRISYKALEFSIKTAVGRYTGAGSVTLGLKQNLYDYSNSDKTSSNYGKVVQFSPSEVTGPNNFTIDLTDLDPNKTWYFAGHEQDMRHVQIGHLKLIGVKEEEYSYLSNDADNRPSDYLNLSKNIYISINGSEPVLASPESFKGVECNFDIRAKVPSSGREQGVYYLEDFGVTQPGRFTVSFYVYDGLEYSTGPIINLEYQPELALAKDENQSDKVEILTSTVKDNVGLSQQYLISATWGFYLETDVVNLGAEAILIQEGTRYILPASSFGFYPNSARKQLSMDFTILKEDVEVWGGQFVETDENGQIVVTRKAFDVTKSFDLLPSVFYTSYTENKLALPKLEGVYFPQTWDKDDIFFQSEDYVVMVDASPDSLPNYFANKIKIQVLSAQPKSGYPIPLSYTASVYEKGSQEEVSRQQLIFNEDRWEGEILVSAIDPGEDIVIRLYFMDYLRETLTYDIETVYTKAGLPTFAKSPIQFTPTTLKPLSDIKWLVKHPLAESLGTDRQKIQYLYTIEVPDLNLTFEPTFSVSTEYFAGELELLEQDILQSFVYDLSTVPNEIIQAKILIKATDSFGKETTIAQSFDIDYRESPQWLSTSAFSILHDYNIAQNQRSLDSYTGLPIVQENSSLDLKMFNADEGIVFKIPRAHDKNDDIVDYVISLARADIADEMPPSELKITKNWLTLPVESLIFDEINESYYYRFNASKYQKNEYFQFTLQARDSTGNLSEPLTSTAIYGCRTTSPIFNQNPINIGVTSQDEGWKINMQWDKFIIEDLGGSAKESGWNIEYYNQYPNLERVIEGYEKDIYLLVELSSTPDFSQEDKIVQRTLRQDGLSRYFDFKPYDNNKRATIFISGEELQRTELLNPEKVYFRFTLVVSYAPNAFVKSVSQSLSYYGNIPTVSYRLHQVGINTNIFESEDVLVISDHQHYRYVRFVGIDDDGNTHDVKIDLKTGNIDNLNLDGGSW